jgi:HD superfamily phosphodiesterase
MDRISAIFSHPKYQQQFQAIQKAEENRIFCCHTMEHFLDVARLMYIYNLQEQENLSRDLIYGAALLHDIGRYDQITKGIPHDRASAAYAGEILPDCGFSEEETRQIQHAILHHRRGTDAGDLLSVYLYRGDKQSRCCFSCKAQEECNWSLERKNLHITL